MLVVRPLPFSEIQPVIYDDYGEPEYNQPLADGAVPVGANAFTVDGSLYPNVVRLGKKKGNVPGVIAVDWFYEEQQSSSSDVFMPLDANRAVKLGGDSQQIRAAIAGLINGSPKRTDEWGGGAQEGSGIDGLPMFYLQVNHPTAPHYNDRWHVYKGSTWVVDDVAHTVIWLTEGRYSNAYPSEYSIWLVKWRTENGVNLASKDAIIQLGANGEWLHGDAFDLGNGVFFVAERMQFATWAPDGYRDDRTRLRAYDYAGNLLHRSDPINEQYYTGVEGSIMSDAYATAKCADGSIVIGITTYKQLAQTGQYQGYDIETTINLTRFTYGAGGFDDIDYKDVEVVVSNQECYFITLQEIPDGSGRLFADLIVYTGPRGSTGWERERRLRIYDSAFNLLEESILTVGIDQEDEWSVLAPGGLGLVGHNDYAPGGWTQESTLYTVQYAELEGVEGDLTDTRREFS